MSVQTDNHNEDITLIKTIYEENNYPSFEMLYKQVKQIKPSIKKTFVKEWHDLQIEVQLLRRQVKEKSRGHITASFVNEAWNMDIFDYSKFVENNSGYKYIFCCIDIYSRKVFIEPLTDKSGESCGAALQSIILENRVKPRIIISDNDAAFNTDFFENVLDRNGIAHNTNIKGDHKVLGIIDSFSKKLRTILSKHFLRTQSTRWINRIQIIINNYNNTPHSSLSDLTPNDATKADNFYIIDELNKIKRELFKRTTTLQTGDKVRKMISSRFQKRSEPIWSDEVFEVIRVRNREITLNDNSTVIRENLLKVPDSTKTTPINVIRQLKK